MKQEVKKDPKVALCRKCHGTGKIVSGRFIRKAETCPQCEGSGRVTVSCEMTLDIRPYKPKGEQVMDWQYRNMGNRHGVSYQKRVADINRIYDLYVKKGVPNREIWRRYIYPVYGISERTFYNILKASANPKNDLPEDTQLYFKFEEMK